MNQLFWPFTYFQELGEMFCKEILGFTTKNWKFENQENMEIKMGKLKTQMFKYLKIYYENADKSSVNQKT